MIVKEGDRVRKKGALHEGRVLWAMNQYVWVKWDKDPLTMECCNRDELETYE